MTASYSASLLDVQNPNLSAYSMSIPSGEVRIRPAPLPYTFEALSTKSFQVEGSVIVWASLAGSADVNSMTKSAKTCPFIADFGLYLISNSLSSLAHFISLPEVSGLCSTCFIGYYVGTSMVCAWKYGRSFRAAVTIAKINFSILGYLSSAPLRARLQ